MWNGAWPTWYFPCRAGCVSWNGQTYTMISFASTFVRAARCILALAVRAASMS